MHSSFSHSQYSFTQLDSIARVPTKKGEFILRPFIVDDQRGILNLWKTAFNREMPLDLWKWKYLYHPFKTEMIVGINEQDEIQVVFSGIGYPANWMGRETRITQLMDIMTHPSVRKSGLFIHAVNQFIKVFTGSNKTVMLYGFPGKYHFDIGEKYLQYSSIDPGVVYLSYEINNPKTSLPERGFSLTPMKSTDKAFDDLWDRCAPDYPFCVIRNSRFLTWRFFAHPFQKYHLYGLTNNFDNKLLGYVVIHTQENAVHILDFLAPDSTPLIHVLMNLLIKRLKDAEYQSISTWLPGQHFSIKALTDFGFEEKSEPLGIIPTIRSFDPGLESQWVCRHLYYTIADWDLL